MDIPENELGAGEVASSTSPTRGGKRQHDDLHDTNETGDDRVHKRQRVDDEIITDGIWDLENMADPANFFGPDQDTAEPDTNPRDPLLDEREMFLSMGFHVPNNESHDVGADPFLMPPDLLNEDPNQAGPFDSGQWQNQDWANMSFEDLLANPVWDLPPDLLSEPQPDDPDPWLLDKNLPSLTESGAPAAGPPAERTGGMAVLDEQLLSHSSLLEPQALDPMLFQDENLLPPAEKDVPTTGLDAEHTTVAKILDEHLRSPDVASEGKLESAVPTEHTNSLEMLDEYLSSPDTTLDSLFTGRDSIGSQTTEPSFFTSPACATPGVRDHQSPSPEQVFDQTRYSDAVFALDPRLLTAESTDFGSDEVYDGGTEANYPLRHSETPGGQNGGETQVEE